MSTISSPGIGSGLDTAGIISKLMTVEAIPLNQITTNENAAQAKITAYGQVQSGLTQFQSSLMTLTNINSLMSVSATSSDPAVASVVSGTGGQAGNYSLNVTQMAQSQQLVSPGQASNTTSIGSGSSTTVTFDFGTISGSKNAGNTYNAGTTFTSNGLASKSITINSSNNTLNGIRDAINASGMGVTASIISDGSASPYRLMLTNSQTGQTQSMRITVSGDSSISNLLTENPAGTQNFTETNAAQNANLTINGISVTNSSNVLANNIPGTTVTLNKIGTSNLSLTNNSSSLSSSITTFVSSYNTLRSSLSNLTSYDQTSHTGADLYGESTVTATQNQLKKVVLSALPAGSNAYTLLNNIGITFQKDGSLAVDSSQLNTAISTNFTAVANLFAANATPSDSLIKFVSSTSDTKPKTYNLNVSTLAARGSLVAAALPASSGSLLAAASPQTNTITSLNNTLIVNLNGTTAKVQITQGTYSSAATLATAVQTAINGTSAFSSSGSSVSVTANGNNQLSFVSNRLGSSSSVALGGTFGGFTDNGSNNLLGGVAGVTTNGVGSQTGIPSTYVISGANNTLNVKLDNISATVQLTNGSYSNASDLAAAVQAAINGTSAYSSIGASVSVTADANNRLSFTSNRYGSTSGVALGGTLNSIADTAANNLLGNAPGVTTSGVDMVASIDGTAALTSGQYILGNASTDQSGLKLQVLGGSTGSRGTVTYNTGVAFQMNNLINTLTGSGGLIGTRLAGLNKSISQFETQKTNMQTRLNMIKKQYQDEYSALDQTVATLNSTSSYLTGQLNSLAAQSNSIVAQNSK